MDVYYLDVECPAEVGMKTDEVFSKIRVGRGPEEDGWRIEQACFSLSNCA